MGLEILFDKKANLDGVIKTENGVSLSVVHKCFTEVTEEGMEAEEIKGKAEGTTFNKVKNITFSEVNQKGKMSRNNTFNCFRGRSSCHLRPCRRQN